MLMPQSSGRLSPAQLAVVINTADPYSVAVGEYYATRRGLPAAHIVRVELPLRPSLSRAEFEVFSVELRERVPDAVQALALAWVQPYAVECNSINAALAFGLQTEICAHSCAVTRASAYPAYTGTRPFAALGMRLSMHLAARSVVAAQAMIERGIASDHSRSGVTEPALAYLASTPDAARTVRERLFPAAGPVPGQPGLQVVRVRSEALPPLQRTLIYQTGLARVPGPLRGEWLPGALADHLTSWGGALERPAGDGQMTALDWIESGATASYGTVSEPCNHLQKFPHPQWLLQAYGQGATAIEAYWRSVLCSGQGVFVGEPLAAPFAAPLAAPPATPIAVRPAGLP